MKIFLSTTTALGLSTFIGSAHGHGYMFEPLSRNYYAYLHGLSWGSQSGVPDKEYCSHCLNTKGPGSVCGTSEQGVNYDLWLDSQGEPMPWNSNGNIYQEGDIITISSFLASHHTGHMEVRACPHGRESTQECFDRPNHRLTFVEDLIYDMPQDENYPERGYYYGSCDFNNNEFSMKFKLPENLHGQKVLLQYWYFTANSCTPEGYAEYYGANSGLDSDFWNEELPVCTDAQWTEEFYAGDWPERFVNCAEVTILSSGDPNTPVSTQEPVVVDEIPQIVPPPVESPTPEPTMAPVPEPTMAPVVPVTPTAPEPPVDNSGGDLDGCCSNDYKTCATWCNQSKEFCEESSACINMKWLDDGPLPSNETCQPRWGPCTNTGTDGCCDGLVCKGNSPWYKQCLAPGDPEPN